MDCALPELMDVIKRVDVITINDEEARQLWRIFFVAAAKFKLWVLNML
jgi:hypothetical protein